MSPITRRGLLRQTALLAAAPFIVPASALGRNGRPPASDRLTVGCVGTGGQGMQNLRGFLSFPETQVLAVCDVEAGHREQARRQVNDHYDADDCQAHGDFRAITGRSDIDICVISTPDHWHALPAIDAMRHGQDVYVEKPLTLTLAEGRALVDAARRYGAVTQVGIWQRSIQRFLHAAEIVRSGALGKVQTIHVGLPASPSHGPQPEMAVPEGFDYDFWLGQAPWAPYTAARCHGAFRFCFDYSGGSLCDWGAHHLDVAQWYMDKDHTGPVEISGQGEFPREGVWNTAMHYNLEFTYGDGLRIIAGDRLPDFGPKFFGEDGRWLHVNRETLATHPADLRRSVLASDDMRDLWVSGSHLGNFLDCVRTRRKTVAPVEVAHRSISLAHLGNIAMRLERPIRWNPTAEAFVNDPEADRFDSRAMRHPWQL